MFESLLEKVLQKFLGQFLEGFDSKNLNVGVWSGNVEINNVSLKSDILSMLELPLQIKFSHIGKLKLKVPWKSIGSSPIEAVLSQVFIIVSAQNPDQWTFQDYAGFKKKLEVLDQFKEECIKKILEKQKKTATDEKDAGYIQKLTLKIIDNIQVKVKNIHIRFEDTITQQYAWGISLNRLEAYTCDENWKKIYIDRTKEENKNIPLIKQLKLSNLGAYWIVHEKEFLNSLPKDKIIEKMKGIIISDKLPDHYTHPFYGQYILLLNLDSNLFQNKKGDLTKPEFSLNVELKTINLSLENLQLQQCIRLAEMITLFQNKLNQKKKSKLALPQATVDEQAGIFATLYEKVQRDHKQRAIKEVLSETEYKQFEIAVIEVPIEVLSDKVRHIIREIQKENYIKEEEKKKADAKKGWTGGWFSSKKTKEDDLLKEEDKAELSKFIDETLADSDNSIQNLQRPPDYIWLDIQFKLVGGYLHITRQYVTKREGVQLYYNNFDGRIRVRDTSSTIELGLEKIAIDLTTEPVDNGRIMVTETKRQTFLSPIVREESNKFLTFVLDVNPLDKPKVDKAIKLKTNSVEVIFNPLLIVRLQQFIDLNVQDDLKNAAWDQVESAQDAYQKSQQLSEEEKLRKQLKEQNDEVQKVLYIDVHCAAPIILLPFEHNGDEKGEVWLVNLGDLKVVTPQYMLENPEKNQFDDYEISLENLTFKYFKQLQRCQDLVLDGKYLLPSEFKQQELLSYNVIENFSIKVTARLLKGTVNADLSVPSVRIDGSIDKLALQIQPAIYEKILKLGNSLAPPKIDDEHYTAVKTRVSLEQVTTERTVLMQNSSKVAPIWKRGTAIKTWTKYTGVLSGGYLYLFAKPKDPQPESYVWVRNSDFHQENEESVGMKNAFLLKNKYNECLFATEKPEQSKQWQDAIEKIRTRLRAGQDDSDEEDDSKLTQKKKVDDKPPRPMNFSFKVKNVALELQDEDCKQWLTVDVNGLGADVLMIQSRLELVLGLQGMHVQDVIHGYQNHNMRYIITSNPVNLFSKEENQLVQQGMKEELICIKVIQIGETDPTYKGINLDVDVKFGTLQAILKPLVVAKLLIFVTPKKQENQILPPEPKTKKTNKSMKEQTKEMVADQATQQNTAAVIINETVLMQVNVQIKSIRAMLVHRFTNLPLAQANIQNTNIAFTKKADEMLLKGSLGNLQLLDLTNYPDTLYDEKDWVLIKPVEMVGVKDSQQSLLSIYFRGLQEGSPKIGKDNVSTFIDVKMSQLIINFMQQPVLRLLDFTLQQLLFALSNPDKTADPAYEDEKQMQKLQQVEIDSPMNKDKGLSAINALSTEESNYLQKLLSMPLGMELKVSIENPQVILKPNQQSTHQLIIDLGHISVSNKRTKSLQRIVKGDYKASLPDGPWVDTFMIVMKDLCLFQKSDNEKERREVTLPFDFNVSVELFGLAPQYALFYNTLEFDPQMKIHVYMAPMIIQMTHREYMFIMKCLFHNIAYDDGFDTRIREENPQHFKAFFEQQQIAAEKAKLLLEQGDTSPALSFQMDAENLTAFLKNDGDDANQLQSNNPSVPFFRIMLVMLRVQFTKRNNGLTEVALLARDLEGSFFNRNQSNLESIEFIEKPFLGPMTVNQSYSLNQMCNLNGLVMGKSKSQVSNIGTSLALASRGQLTQAEKRNTVFKFEDVDEKAYVNALVKLDFHLQMSANGDKRMSVNLSEFKLMVHAGSLFQVLALVAMDDPTLTPAPGKYVKKPDEENKLVQKSLQQQEEEKIKQQQAAGGSLDIKIGLKNVIICAPTTIENNVLAIRGEFSISMGMSVQKKVDEVIQLLKQKGIDVRPGEEYKECQELNSYMSINVGIDNFEVCICSAFELVKKEDFRQVRKREILVPVSIDVKLVKYLQLTQDLQSFIDHTVIGLKLSSTKLKVCFKDIGLLQAGVNYQLNQMPKAEVKQEEKKVEVDVKKIEAELKRDQEKKLQEQLKNINQVQVAKQKIKCEFGGFQIVILNDMGNTFTPILDFQLRDITILFEKNNIFQTVSLVVPLRLNYYNPRSSRWEPVIELTGFNIEFYQNFFGGALGATTIAIDSSEVYPPLSINASTMFFQTLFRTLFLLQKMAEPLMKRNEEKKSQSRTVSLEERKSQQDQQLIKSEEEVFSQVSPYAVVNLTGYPIQCQPIEYQGLSKTRMQQEPAQQVAKLVLQTNDKQNIKLSENEYESIDNQGMQQRRISIVVQMPKDMIFKINEVDMDRIKTKSNVQKDQTVFTSVKLDEVTNAKILTVSAPVIVVNYTNETIVILIEDRNSSNQAEIQKFQQDRSSLANQTPVPIGFTKPSLSMRFKSCPTFSQKVNLDKLLKPEFLNKPFEVVTEDNRYMLLRVQEEPDIKGKFKIFIEPPYKITNSLPKSIYIQLLNDHKETTTTLKVASQDYIEDYRHSYLKKVYVRILVEGFYWSGEHRLDYEPKEQEKEVTKNDCTRELKIVDADNKTLSLLIFEPWKLVEAKGCREFVVYCTGYLKNISPYQLQYATIKDSKKNKKKQPLIIPGQQSINYGDSFDRDCILMGPECGKNLSLSDSTEHFSPNPTSIMGVGACQLDMLKQEDGVQKQVFIGGNIQLKLCNNQHLLFNKIITLEPRFILVNQCPQTVQVRAKGSLHVDVELQPNKRVPFMKLFDEKKFEIEEQIYINFNIPEEDFQWSGDINIASIGIMYCQLHHRDDLLQRKYFSVDARQEGSNMFVIIKEMVKDEAPYKFINEVKEIYLVSSDLPKKLEYTGQDDGQNIFYFAWDEPCHGSKEIKLDLDVKDKSLYKNFSFKISPDQIGQEIPLKLKPIHGQKSETLELLVTILSKGFQKIILLKHLSMEDRERRKKKQNLTYIKDELQGDDNQEEEKQMALNSEKQSERTSRVSLGGEDVLKFRVNIKLNQINLSLIHNSDQIKRPAEYLNITLKNIEIIQLTKEFSQTSQFRVQYMNIDNNWPFFVNYPVILTPLKNQIYKDKKYFLNVLMKKDTTVSDINLFEAIIFEIDPFVVKVEEQLITSVMDFTGSILNYKKKVEEFEKQQEVRKSLRESDSEELKQGEQHPLQVINEEGRLQQLHWYTDKLPEPSLPTFINNFVISPIQIQLTFQAKSKTSDMQSDDMAIFKSVASALGVALSNIDEAPLNFKGFKIENCFDSAAGITTRMVTFYKNEAISQVLKLLGSLSVLGNPVGLFNNISTGVSDLIERPVEGFTKGPLEGGMGLVQGAGSLVQHTVAGAFNSLNKITGSVGSGLSSLTMDEEYIKERDKMRLQKPKHIGQGLNQAGASLFQGFYQGISGVFLKPFEGGKKDGIKGVFKGTLQGLTGLIIKPVTGIFDAAAKTTEGIKNTVTYFEDKPNENRERNVRPVYGPEGYFIEYVPQDAEGFAMMHFIKKGFYSANKFVAAFMITPDVKDPENKFMFVLTMEDLFYMSFKTKKKVWIIPVKDFESVESIPQGVRIRTNTVQKQLKDKKEAIVIIGPDQKDFIYDQIVQLNSLVKYLS